MSYRFFLLSNTLLQYIMLHHILYHLYLLKNIYTNTLYNSLIVTPAYSVNQYSSLELIMVPIIKPKGCIDTHASPNLVMVSSILPWYYTDVSTAPVLTMSSSINPKGCTEGPVNSGLIPPLFPLPHTSLSLNVSLCYIYCFYLPLSVLFELLNTDRIYFLNSLVISFFFLFKKIHFCSAIAILMKLTPS